MHEILVGAKILKKNDEIAAANREAFSGLGLFSVNLISSPGSGKTTLIERTVERIGSDCRLAVIEGDLQTELDKERVERCGVPATQITTGRSCHLDAHMVSHTIEWLKGLKPLELLIIENVGNMVCPAEYDLGEDMKVAVMSVTEGDDKPLKYPAIFHASSALVINKTDLTPYTDFNIERARENALAVNPALKIFETSCTTGAGLTEWCDFLIVSTGRS